MADSNQEQIAKYKRKTDQSISMHTILSQRYTRYLSFADIVIWFITTIFLTMTWFDPQLLKILPVNLDEQQLRLWFGLLSLGIFLASLLPLILNWRDKASAHNAAAKALTDLKFCLREAEKTDNSKVANEVISQYSRVMDGICSIPEKDFLRLKQLHLRKVAFSKFLDVNPGRLFLVNKFCFLISNLGCKLMRKLNVSESYGIIASSEDDNDIGITRKAVKVVRELKNKAIEGRLKLRLLKVDKNDRV